jgi:Tfp pilus assembly protein PilO
VSRRIPLIAGAVVVVLLLGWYVIVWRPAASASKSAQASKEAAQVLQSQLAAQLAGLVTLQKTLPAEEAKLRKAEIEVPSSASEDTVIDQINSIALADHILWTNESQSLGTASSSAATTATTVAATATTTATTVASAVASTSGDTTLTMTLDVAGSYAAMYGFIVDLEHLPRLIVIDTIGFAPKSVQSVSATLSARAFYSNTPSLVMPTSPAGS